MVRKQICVILVQIYFIIYTKTNDIYKHIQKMLKQDLTLQNMNQNAIPLRGHCLKKKKREKVIGLMKNELRAKTYSCLIDDGSEDKKAKDTKKCVIKQKLKLENYKNCFEATQHENKINCLEEKKIDIDSIKDCIKNNKSMLKIQ